MSVNTLHRVLLMVAEGDEKGFQALFHLYKQRIYGYAMHFTRSATASEEMVQEIFLKLWLHKEDLLEINNFEAYLYTITRNLCFDYLKKLAHEQAMKQEWRRSTVASEENTEAVVIYNSYERLLQQAVEQLPPQQKNIYTLSHYHGKKYEEIAEYLHISRNTVKVHLAKARTTIRKYLATHLDTIALLLTAIFFKNLI